jgi:hypothetical protein
MAFGAHTFFPKGSEQDPRGRSSLGYMTPNCGRRAVEWGEGVGKGGKDCGQQEKQGPGSARRQK